MTLRVGNINQAREFQETLSTLPSTLSHLEWTLKGFTASKMLMKLERFAKCFQTFINSKQKILRVETGDARKFWKPSLKLKTCSRLKKRKPHIMGMAERFLKYLKMWHHLRHLNMTLLEFSLNPDVYKCRRDLITFTS